MLVRSGAGAALAALVSSAVLLAGCGSVSDAVRTEGEGDSSVVQGENANDGSSDDAAPEAELAVVEHGFTQLPAPQYGEPMVTFAAVFENTGDALATDAQVQISFKDGSGSVVESREEYLTAVLPGSKVAVGDTLYGVKGVKKMTVQLLPGQSESLEEAAPDFTVSKVRTRPVQYGGLKTTASIDSPFTKDLKDVQAVAVYRNKRDKVIGGAFTFVNFVPAKGQASVTINDTVSELPARATTDVYVAITSLSLLG